jgi:hypothetical protein
MIEQRLLVDLDGSVVEKQSRAPALDCGHARTGPMDVHPAPIVRWDILGLPTVVAYPTPDPASKQGVQELLLADAGEGERFGHSRDRSHRGAALREARVRKDAGAAGRCGCPALRAAVP